MLAIAALVTASAAINIATVSTELSSVVLAWSLNVRIVVVLAKRMPTYCCGIFQFFATDFTDKH
jgi:hypothetical protein